MKIQMKTMMMSKEVDSSSSFELMQEVLPTTFLAKRVKNWSNQVFHCIPFIVKTTNPLERDKTFDIGSK